MKDNIQKVINLNEYIAELSKEFEVLTYSEMSWVYSCPTYDKMHTLLYHDYDIHMFVSGEKYCIMLKGNIYELNDIDPFIIKLNRILDILYYLDCVRGFR